MEAATTLSSPQRRQCTTVQKSLSLPSYARAGGEGIDHKLIFAALEQKERVRRKSRIFAPREKSARQNLFCLPIPSSGAKCRETSLSSDTSCSSLEYQKSSPLLKRKKDDKLASPKQKPKSAVQDSVSLDPKQGLSETQCRKSPLFQTKESTPQNQLPFLQSKEYSSSRQKPSVTETQLPNFKPGTPRYETTNAITIYQSETYSNSNFVPRDDFLDRIPPCSENLPHLKVIDQNRNQRSPANTLRLHLGSSDNSMERSSRSSNDSLNRRERRVALKARVEAAREKLGDSSSSDEDKSLLTHYNSDGVIHRSLRDVKSRSSRQDRRLRRRSQDEFSITRMKRRNLSLSLNPADDSISLGLQKLSTIEDDSSHLEIKTDFCPSPSFPDLILKKQYFSDFPNKEINAHSVQTRIRVLEEEERKRRSGSDFRVGIPFRQSPQNMESPSSTLCHQQSDKQVDLLSKVSAKLSQDLHSLPSSPIPRLSQAPTPPPRSPKSITFVNKAFIQHQNALLSQGNSLERKMSLQQSISAAHYAKIFDNSSTQNAVSISESKAMTESTCSPVEKANRESISNRRRTCGNFDFIDDNVLNELCSIGNSNSTNCITSLNKISPTTSMKKDENMGFFSGAETLRIPSEDDIRSKLWKSKWQENEERREFMFNSLENKKKVHSPSWVKSKNSSSKADVCLCRWFPEKKLSCSCKDKVTSSSEFRKNDYYSNLDFKEKNASDSVPYLYKDSLVSNSDDSKRSFIESAVANDNSMVENKKGTVTNSYDCKKENTAKEKCELKTDLKDVNKISAAIKLDTAMQELENIYKSLKISCDNLSDRNTISSVSLSDNDSNLPKPKVNSLILANENSCYPRRSSICETNLKSHYGNYKMHAKPFPVSSSVMADKSFALTDTKNSQSEQQSIDELFQDLTQQIDMEQKLYKDPRDNWQQHVTPSSSSNRIQGTNSPISIAPQVSLHKEFYENLCRNTSNQNKKLIPLSNEISDSTDLPTKKKHKAVRSLSENICSLMGNTVTQDTIPDKNEIDNTAASKAPLKGKLLPKYYDRIVVDPTYNVSNRDRIPNLTQLSNITQESGISNVKPEEIRQIRVSMDSGIFLSKSNVTNTIADNRQYPSLTSAVCQSASSKADLPKPPIPGRSSSPTCHSKENVSVLDETGLEKLLNSLLGEVPQPKSSLMMSNEMTPSSPTTSPSGEMRVLQHLDVIRLKPVPS